MFSSIKASDLDRIMICPGSIPLQEPLPNAEETDAAKEGTAAHYVAQDLFRAVVTPAFRKGLKTPNGWVVDQDMFTHAKTYVDNVNALPGVLHVECKADFEILSGLVIRCRGDAVKWDDASKTLYVDDFKYGWRPVDVVGSWQLLAYAIGAARTLGVVPERFVLTIDQPRPFHVDGRRRSWTLTPDEIGEYYSRMVARLSSLDDTLSTGDHCDRCKAAPGHCPAARTSAFNAIDVTMNSSAVELSAEDHAAELEIMSKAASVAKKRLEWLEDYAKERLKRGELIPGRYLRPAHGTSQWTSDKDVVALQKETGIKLRETVSVSPAEAIRRGVDEEKVKAYSFRPDRGVALAKGSSTQLAEKVFTNE